jgi:hypothetical protein
MRSAPDIESGRQNQSEGREEVKEGSIGAQVFSFFSFTESSDVLDFLVTYLDGE